MNSIKFLLLVFMISISFSQKQNAVGTTVKSDPVKLWENDDNNINNPELKRALEQLRKEFQQQRNEIQSNYKLRISELKKMRDSEIDILKKSFVEKRNSLKTEYGIKDIEKPKKLKANKKDDKKAKKKAIKPSQVNTNPVKKAPLTKVDKKPDSEKIEGKEKK